MRPRTEEISPGARRKQGRARSTEEKLGRSQADLLEAFEEIKRLKDRLQDENLILREEIDHAFMFDDIVGSSPVLQSVLSSIVKVAPTDTTILISGETGTGKELSLERSINVHGVPIRH